MRELKINVLVPKTPIWSANKSYMVFPSPRCHTTTHRDGMNSSITNLTTDLEWHNYNSKNVWVWKLYFLLVYPVLIRNSPVSGFGYTNVQNAYRGTCHLPKTDLQVHSFPNNGSYGHVDSSPLSFAMFKTLLASSVTVTSSLLLHLLHICVSSQKIESSNNL